MRKVLRIRALCASATFDTSKQLSDTKPIGLPDWMTSKMELFKPTIRISRWAKAGVLLLLGLLILTCNAQTPLTELEDDGAPTKAVQEETGTPAAKQSEQNLDRLKALGASPLFKTQEEENPEAYILRAGDTVEVSVYQEDDLTNTQQIDASGFLNLKLIKRVRVSGLSLIEAENLIEQRYADFLVEPSVSLIVTEKAKRRFVILGQVQSPGYYEVARSIRLDLLQAIALAGGYTRIAGRVTIKRTTSTGEIIKSYSLRSLRRKPVSEIPLVAEDDTVIVGESFF